MRSLPSGKKTTVYCFIKDRFKSKTLENIYETVGGKGSKKERLSFTK